MNIVVNFYNSSLYEKYKNVTLNVFYSVLKKILLIKKTCKQEVLSIYTK